MGRIDAPSAVDREYRNPLLIRERDLSLAARSRERLPPNPADRRRSHESNLLVALGGPKPVLQPRPGCKLGLETRREGET